MMKARWEPTLSQRSVVVSCIACALVFFLALPPTAAFATALDLPPTMVHPELNPALAEVPFSVGEELMFEIRWIGLLAGHASMGVKSQVSKDGHDVYHIMTKAQSSPVFSLFYNVHDVGETYVDVRGLYPWYYRLNQREGTRIIERTVTFDQIRGLAIYTKNREIPQELAVPAGVQDSLSSVYLLRTLPLQVGHATTIKTFSNGRTYDVAIDVLRREKVDVYWGSVETLVVRPVIKFKEILRQKGEVLIWVTDNASRIPVRMQTEITIGSIVATLIDVRSTR